MKRIILLAIVATFLCLPLAGCNGSCPTLPSVTLVPPISMDAMPRTVAGPRLMQAPTFYAPTYTPAQAPAACCAPAAATANQPLGYSCP